jgi:succinate-semialdehyde dehydrogenase/glutarate-semialdehyde dehydrogenase
MTVTASYSEILLLIDGEWISAKDRTSSAVINPATGELIGQVPHATAIDLERAIE